MYYVQEVTSYSYSNVPHMTCNDTHTGTHTHPHTEADTRESTNTIYDKRASFFFGDAK